MQVAVKVLLPKASTQGRVQREFVLEQRIWSQMDHPNIVKVHYVRKAPASVRMIVRPPPVLTFLTPAKSKYVDTHVMLFVLCTVRNGRWACSPQHSLLLFHLGAMQSLPNECFYVAPCVAPAISELTWGALCASASCPFPLCRPKPGLYQ